MLPRVALAVMVASKRSAARLRAREEGGHIAMQPFLLR